MASAEDSLREIPEVSNQYPENRMFGTLPSFGLYIRHAENIRLHHLSVAIEQPDGRPAILLEDVHDSVWEDVSIQSLRPTPMLSICPNCSGINLT